MKLAKLHTNNISPCNKNISFRGINTSKILNSENIEKISRCHFDDLLGRFSKKAGTEVIEVAKDGAKLLRPKNGVFTQLCELPKDIGLYFSKKLHIKSNYLSKYAIQKEQKTAQMAANGFYEYGERYVNEVIKELKLRPPIESCNGSTCTQPFTQLCDNVTKKFLKQLNGSMKPDKAQYNTRDERTLVKLLTGFVASLFIFNDFHNNSARDGKLEDKKADNKGLDKEAKEKFVQEMKETICETGAQFATLGGLSGWVNNSTFAAPILNTLTSLLFRVTSRLSSNKPLTRIDVPDKVVATPISINEFATSLKEGKPIDVVKYSKVKTKDDKKHLLSLKNVMLLLGASVAGGFALRYGTPKIKGTKVYNNVTNAIKNNSVVKNLSEKYYKSTVGDVKMSADELTEIVEVLNKGDNKQTSVIISRLFKEQFKKAGASELFIGQYEKMTHIPFTKIPMSKRELYKGALIPFKIAGDIFAYPYKLVATALEKLKVIKPVDHKTFKLKDDFEFVNIFQDFKAQKAKFNSKPEKEFIEFYKNHFEKRWASALNNVTRSNVDNADIGKLTQILGTATSIYFATTDDFNRTARQTGDVEQAGVDARKRGLNKFIRIISQISLIDLFNHTFKISYGKSLFGATLISSICTAATEAVSHALSGMPIRQLKNKEEYDKYHEKHKDGIISRTVEKLTK